MQIDNPGHQGQPAGVNRLSRACSGAADQADTTGVNGDIGLMRRVAQAVKYLGATDDEIVHDYAPLQNQDYRLPGEFGFAGPQSLPRAGPWQVNIAQPEVRTGARKPGGARRRRYLEQRAVALRHRLQARARSGWPSRRTPANSLATKRSGWPEARH